MYNKKKIYIISKWKTGHFKKDIWSNTPNVLLKYNHLNIDTNLIQV